MEGTIAEIRMFAGNFAPTTWAICQGQIMSIAQNTALFALLGTTYGGNGQTTFALPDYRGRSPFGVGQGPGLPDLQLGEVSGSESTTLINSNLPAHNHIITTNSTNVGGKAERPGTTDLPQGNYHSILAGSSPYSSTTDGTMAALPNPTLGISGGNQPFANRPPFLGINFIICLQGIFPSRN
jgi:microcystin-dependent protein